VPAFDANEAANATAFWDPEPGQRHFRSRGPAGGALDAGPAPLHPVAL